MSGYVSQIEVFGGARPSQQKAWLPQIVVTDRPMRDISRDSLNALRDANEPPTMFVRAGVLVHVTADENGRDRIVMMEGAHLRGRMDRAADYLRVTKDGLKHIAPPTPVVADILALQPTEWRLPALESHAEAPFLRRDGTVVTTVGYDSITKVLYSPAPGLMVPAIPDSPKDVDVQTAVGLLLEALREFPFENEASRANALALLVTPCIRQAIDGPVPLALIDAPQAGTGKSLLASFVAEIATGSEAAMMNAPREEEEWRKAITATLISGSNIVIYDNVQYVLQSASLALALTARSWKDRILGLSQTVTVAQRCTWVATGNNIRLGGDLPRRCYWIRLDSQMSRPWTRTGFRHADLIGWARERRGEFLAALLTLARSWFASGQPEASIPALGSFEHWAKTVGGILAHAGVRGFLGNIQEFYDLVDDTTLQWESFLGEIHAGYGDDTFTVAHLSDRLRTDQTLRDSLPSDLSGAWGERDTASGGFKVKVGKAFQVRVGTRYGNDGLFLERAGVESKGKQIRWRVVRAGVQGSQVSSLPTRESLIDVAQADLTERDLQTLQPCSIADGKENLPTEPRMFGNGVPPEQCFSCGETRFRELRDGGWVCEVCHPA